MEKTQNNQIKNLKSTIAEINAIVEKEKNAPFSYTVKLYEKNKALILPVKTKTELQKDGLNIEKTYFSYNKNQTLFNSLIAYMENAGKYRLAE